MTAYQNTYSDDDFQREVELEREMVNRGRERFLRRVSSAQIAGKESHIGYARMLMKRGIEPVAQAVEAFVAGAMTGKPGVRPIAARLLSRMDARVASFIALRVLLDRAVQPRRTIQSAAIEIGRELEFELRLTEFREQDKADWNWVQQHLRKREARNPGYRRNVFRWAFNRNQTVDYEPMPPTERAQVGFRMIDLILAHTPYFEKVAVTMPGRGGFRKAVGLRPTPECLKYIEDYVNYSATLTPDFMPTIIPPKSWASAFGGGYYTMREAPLNLVKTENVEYLQSLDARIKKGEMPDVTAALNALQDTAWRVNRRVLEVAEALWNAGGNVAGLPNKENEPYPPCPVCGRDVTEIAMSRKVKHECLERLKEEDPKAFKQWKLEASAAADRNDARLGRRTGIARTLALARRLRDERAFYFPYQLDFRGRIYAVPAFLNPQGTQVAKGLLEFAEGRPLGTEEAARWLAVHISNCWGNDKVSLDDRVRWVKEHERKIIEAAHSPLEARWWTEADEPLPFLAACMDWAGYIEEGLAHVSHVPVAMDGTCNGLQIFSLILRDAVGGHAVNLTPTETPQDIYAIVAEKVRALLEEDAASKKALPVYRKDGGEGGRAWYDRREAARRLLALGIDRKTTKRQVMVLPYGGTHQSCVEYTEEWLKERVWAARNTPAEWDTASMSVRAGAHYLAGYIWQALGVTVIAAVDAMKFLQGVAGVVAGTDQPIRWTTPCGFPVRKAYKEVEMERVKTLLGDSICKFNIRQDSVKYSSSRQRTAMPPNYVHSLDAAALMKTVVACSGKGVRSYAMIHDSYGTHAADAPTLAAALREVFVDMFQENQLERLLLEVRAALPDATAEHLPPLPPTGSLNIDEVKKAAFFFA